MTCCLTISSIIPVVSAEASAVSPETYIIYEVELSNETIAVVTAWNKTKNMQLAHLLDLRPVLCCLVRHLSKVRLYFLISSLLASAASGWIPNLPSCFYKSPSPNQDVANARALSNIDILNIDGCVSKDVSRIVVNIAV